MIGYIRVSTKEQKESLQLDALTEYAQQKGYDLTIYNEKQSTSNVRPELQAALKAMTKGDVFVVYKLDRLARSSAELFRLMEQMKEKGVEFVSLSDQLDTTTPSGKAMLGMLAVFAEFEKDLNRERTIAGLEAARKRGRFGGRPSISESTKKNVYTLFKNGESTKNLATQFNIGRSTVYKIINEMKEREGECV